MRTFAKIIGYGLVLLLIAAAIGFVYKFTNGFNEDFKTFYVEYGSRQILTTENKMTLNTGDIHRFNVKYTFDKEDAEPKDYKVKIVSNMTRDFDYTVDGERYLFSKLGNLTDVFDIKKSDTYFELHLPDGLTFSKVLMAAQGGKSINVPTDALTSNPYPFRLQISSYNEKVTYNIDFTFGSASESSSTGSGQSGGENTGNTTPNTPNNPSQPNKPAQQYSLSWRVEGNDENLVWVNVDCPSSWGGGEKVELSVALISDYDSEVLNVAVYSNGKFLFNASKGSLMPITAVRTDFYNFEMPQSNVEIVIAIKPVVKNEYLNISYDVLGYGSNACVNVYCAEAAKPGEYVMASIYIAYGYENTYEISRVVLQNADTGEDIQTLERFNEFYDFTMPDCDVVIMIYLDLK